MKKLSLILFLALVLFACGKQHDEQLKTTAYHKTAHVRAADGARECMDIDMQIEFPTESQNPEALTPIQQSIMQHLFPDYCASMPIKEAVNAYADTLAKEYQDDNYMLISEDKELMESVHYFPAEFLLNADINNINDNILSYQIEEYNYYGGAHGSTTTTYLVFNLNNGQQLTYADFLNLSDQELTLLLQQELCRQTQLTQLQLEELGYDFNFIKPTQNFFVETDSLVFHYNAYDIAPYSVGAQSIKIPRSK